VYIDEAQSILYPGIDELFAKGGGAGLKMHGFCQSVSQIYEIIGEHGARSILDNCNSKLFLRVSDPKTALYISDHFGPKIVLSPIMDLSGSISFRETEEPAVRPEQVLRLNKREFYFTSYEDIYFGTTTTTSKHELKVKYPTAELVA
jgi:type IV secretory pathway TraG/TraD family ATPase VirD4